MKQNLGRVIIFFLIPLFLFAKEEYVVYDYTVSKENIYQYESVAFSLKVKQIYDKEVMFFELTPQKNDQCEIILLSKKRQEASYHSASKEYRYLIIPKKVGVIDITFSLDIRLARDDAVAQTYVGSRDNVKYIPTTKHHIDTIHFTLHTKQLPDGVVGVGKFSLKESFKQKNYDPFDPIYINYTVEGVGYIKNDFAILKNIDGVTLFEGIIKDQKKPTLKGYRYIKEFQYGLVGSKSFVIPSKEFMFYDPQTKEFYTLQRKKKLIHLQQKPIESLVDTTIAPKKEESFFSLYFIDGIYYFLAFLLGFFTKEIYNRYIKNIFSQKEKKNKSSLDTIKTPQELLKFLMQQPNKEIFWQEIDLLEAYLYQKKEISFSKIKKSVQKRMV